MKDTIVAKAFEQYLMDGYEKVTISTLQKSLDIGRATMYYYFTNKEELFEAVMKKYFRDFIFKGMERITPTCTVLELIDIYIATYTEISTCILNLGNREISLSAYNGLLFYAYSHNSTMASQINEVRQTIHKTWCDAIRNSIAAGEVREDIDVDTIANMFESAKGMFSEAPAEVENVKKGAELARKANMELYKLIKK